MPQVCRCWCPPFSVGHVAFLFICLPGLSQHFYSFVSQVSHWWCPPGSAGHVAFLCICLPGLSLLVSALFCWPCRISIHLSPRSVTGGVRSFPLAMWHFYSFVSQVCRCWCPPFSAGHVAFLFVCLPGLSLVVSMWHFYSFVSQVCRCWCPPFSAGHAAFLLICLPCDLFQCRTAGIHPFPLSSTSIHVSPT